MDEIAEAIEKLSDAATRLLDCGLTERAVVLLIHDNCATDRRGRKPTKTVIRDVLHAARDLDVTYLVDKTDNATDD